MQKVDKSNTVKEIKSWLDDNDIYYNSNMLKDDLLALVDMSETEKATDNTTNNTIDNITDNTSAKPKTVVRLTDNWRGYRKGQVVSVTNRQYKEIVKQGKG